MTEVNNDPGGDAMGKPYWNGPEGSYEPSGARRFAGRYAGGESGAPTSDSYDPHHGYGHAATDTYDAPTHRFEPEEEQYDPYDYEGYADYDEEYDDYPPDNRWRWIAGLAGAILLIAAIAIAFAMRGGGDTASTSATPSDTASATSAPQDAVSTTPRTVIATIPPTTPAAAEPLPPETIVTVTPSAQESAPAAPPAPEPAEAAPPPPPERAITYTVTGSRSLFDLVTIIYSDEQGFPRTDINVTLPWTKTVVLNPGVETKSLTATSLTGQLNCSVTDGNGAVLKQQNTNTAIAAC